MKKPLIPTEPIDIAVHERMGATSKWWICNAFSMNEMIFYTATRQNSGEARTFHRNGFAGSVPFFEEAERYFKPLTELPITEHEFTVLAMNWERTNGNNVFSLKECLACHGLKCKDTK